MKRDIMWKAVWVVGVYAILITILYLVVLYKVKWEHKDLNTYLYFYNCSNNVCTSVEKPDDYYSRTLCEDGVCPYIKCIIDNNIVLERNKTSWLYNYMTGEIVNNSYIEYRYLYDNLFVVTNSSNRQGVININGDILVDINYDYIDNYVDGLMSYRLNNLYGVIDSTGAEIVRAIYDEFVLIDNNIFAGKKDNVYQFYNYSSENPISDVKYDYVFAYKDLILVINNKKIDILTDDLDSTLLLKINTFYEYSTGQERDSLNIRYDEDYVYFDVFISDTQYVEYKYSIANKKLV